MAALTAITPLVTGATSAGAAVSASDTVDASILGGRGAYLEILNGGGSPDTVTISDFGSTPAGSQLPSNTYTVSVTNGTNKVIFLKPSQVNPSTGLVTVAHSFTTSVTYKLYPVSI
jgi:hypothetical protein